MARDSITRLSHFADGGNGGGCALAGVFEFQTPYQYATGQPPTRLVAPWVAAEVAAYNVVQTGYGVEVYDAESGQIVYESGLIDVSEELFDLLPQAGAVKGAVKAAAVFAVPKLFRSAKGVHGAFSVKGFVYRIDTNATGLAPGELFHVHVYRNGAEVAKITNTGRWLPTHGGATLLKPSQIDTQVRREVNRLVTAANKSLK